MPEPLILKSAPVGPWPMNSYVIICPETRQSVLIDPGADPEILKEMLVDSMPIAILLTHAHHDHIGELQTMKAQLNVPVYMHPAEAHMLATADVWFADGDDFALGQHTVHIIHTPGHTPGMVTFMLPDGRAIVGDTIFKGGPGRTWTPQDFTITLDTMRNIVFTWPDNTECFPGHGPSFFIGDERPVFEAFRQRRHPEDLHGDVTWDM